MFLYKHYDGLTLSVVDSKLGNIIKEKLTITTTGTKKIDLIFGEIQSRLRNKNVTVDVKTNADSTVLSTVTVDVLATPGLKTIISFVVPVQRSGKVELQYLHEYAGVNASVGLTTNPVVNLFGIFGTNVISVGADVSLDTGTGNFTKCNAGLSITNTDLIASVLQQLRNRVSSMISRERKKMYDKGA